MMKYGILLTLLLLGTMTFGQVSTCSDEVPSYVVDMTGDPDSLYMSPHESRDGVCCDVSSPDRCVEFFITLDPAAIAINFEILVGAVPPGALFYQINCGPEVPVGQPICLEGQGPHILTFCKPGNNPNTYGITSIPGIISPQTTTVRATCESFLTVNGVLDSTIVWNDVSSGTGLYNDYLSCTTECDTTIVSPDAQSPPFIDYEVCGQVVSELCGILDLFLCDTIRVTVLPPVEVSILPDDPVHCTEDIFVDLYTQLDPPQEGLIQFWTDGADGGGNIISFDDTLQVMSTGVYSVIVQDTAFANCYLDTATVELFNYEVDLDTDKISISCFGEDDGVGLVTPLSGLGPFSYAWDNGAMTQLVTGLTPGVHSVTVYDQNGCEAVGQVNINEPPPLVIVNSSVTGVSCTIGDDGSISISAGGGTPPYEYDWSNGSTGATITGLEVGTYTVTITDDLNCTLIDFFDVTPPDDQVVALLDATTSSSCQECNGEIYISVFEGTPPYTFNWSDGSNQEDRVAVCSGSYEVTVTDATGCQDVLAINLGNEGNLVVLSTQVDQNVLCNGGSSGQATTVASGGTPPFTYQWDNGETTNTATQLDAGIHTVSVTDAMGCQDSDEILILEPPGMVGQAFIAFPISCFGGNDGVAAADASGGIPPYSYQWSNGSNSQIATGLGEGVYDVTISDQNNCETSVQINLVAPDELLSSAPVIMHLTCPESADGAISVTASGGTPPYTYQWSNGMTGSSINGLGSGLYTLTITDANNCSIVTQGEVLSPTNPLSIALAGTTTPLCGNCNGTINISVSQGLSPYTYLWSNGSTNEDLSALCSGIFQVTVTDAEGCQVSLNAEVEEEGELVMVTAQVGQHVDCNGNATGQATANPSGGTPPYSFQWDNGETSITATQLAAGNHTVTVTDASGCQDAANVLIVEPFELTGIANVVFPIACFGNPSGIASAIGMNGTPPYSYIWSNGSTGQIATGLSAGTYFVTIVDQNTCEAISQVTFDSPDELIASAPVTTPITCPGSNDGTISVTVTGGTPPYDYLWNNGMATSSISGLSPQFYSLTVTDANNCTVISTADILPHDNPIQVNLNTVTIPMCGECNGSVDISVDQGVPPYTFLWSNGTTDEDLTGVCSGIYGVTVTGSDGCSETLTSQIGEGVDPLVLSALTVQNVLCNGESNGQATASATGGTTPYTFEWDNGETGSSALQLNAGIHGVTLTDALGCQAIDSVLITEPTLFSGQASSFVPLLCFGDNNGFIVAIPNGGLMPYSYLWNNGSTDQVLTDMSAGNYEVTITDDNGCQTTAQVSVTSPAELITGSPVITPLSCPDSDDGSISISASGGTPPYNYLWSNGMTGTSISGLAAQVYDVTVTDANNCSTVTQAEVLPPNNTIEIVLNSETPSNCNSCDGALDISVNQGAPPFTYTWSNGMTTEDISGLCPDVYQVTVTDSDGCQESALLEVGNVNNLIVVFSNVQDNIDCIGVCNGEGTASGANGVPPYQYQWPDGSTTATVTGLCPDNYTVTVTDAVGCSAASNLEILQTEITIAVSPEVSSLSCFGASDGMATITASGGTLPYTYLWSNGETSDFVSQLDAGIHNFTVTDAFGCSAEDSVFITEPPLLTGQATSFVPILCFGDNNGFIVAVTNGGIMPYSYLWNNGSTDQVLTDMGTGNYEVTITDNNGCQVISQVDVTSPDQLVAGTPLITPLSCPGSDDGSISITASGGVAPYEFFWSNGQTGSLITGLAPQLYSVTVTDANGCSTEAMAEVLPHDNPIQISVNSATTPFCGDCNGTVDITVSQGVPPYTFLWSTGSTDEDLSGVCSGIYGVTVTDSDGCESTISAEVSPEGDMVTVSTSPTQQILCPGTSTGEAIAMASGGTPPYTYAWDNGQTSATASMLAGGVHFVTVTDAQGCQDTNSVLILEPAGLSGQTTSVFQESCFGANNGIAAVEATGGTPPYSYFWSNGDSGQIADELGEGIYIVTITDLNGCQATAQADISSPEELVSGNPVISPLTCPESADGTISVLPSGGTPPYEYLWNNGMTGASIGGLEEGVYRVTVTDANGCTDESQAEIMPPNNPVTLTLNSTSNSICGNCNGEIDITVSQGTLPYTFLWNDGFDQEDRSGLCEGQYQVTVTDSSGCQETLTAEIGNEENTITITVEAESTVLCNGGSSGQAISSASGGDSPYQFEWDNGETSNVAAMLSAGIHYVTATDSNGCQSVDSVLITEPPALTAVIANVADVACFGELQGAAVAGASGGQAPYAYIWSHGPQSPDVTGLGAGTYTVTIIDANGCTDTEDIEIGQPEPLVVDLEILENISCDGFFDGMAEASASGGTSPYFFVWSDGTTNLINGGLDEGSHTVTVTDDNGCTEETSILLEAPEPVVITLDSEPITCEGADDGTINVSASGGQNEFTYIINGQMPQESEEFTGLPAGTYFIQAIDNQGCSGAGEIVIPEGPVLFLDLVPDTAFIELGEIVEINSSTNGTLPIIYSWEPSPWLDCLDCPDPVSSPLESVIHTLVIEDDNGCQAIEDVHIFVNNQIDVFIPNAFSPNGDGVNDTFTIFTGGIGVNVKMLRIFDRWGELIFENENFPPDLEEHGWDGTFKNKKLNPAVFVYYLSLELLDGSEVFYKGDITIIR